MAERGTTQEVNEIREMGSLEICTKNIVIVSLGKNSYGRESLEGSMLHKIISVFCGGLYIITHYVSVSTYRKYSPITSLEQREQYQEDFCAEYDEYKDLHSRIATITHMFIQLGSKIKSLSPGTQEYKVHDICRYASAQFGLLVSMWKLILTTLCFVPFRQWKTKY